MDAHTTTPAELYQILLPSYLTADELWMLAKAAMRSGDTSTADRLATKAIGCVSREGMDDADELNAEISESGDDAGDEFDSADDGEADGAKPCANAIGTGNSELPLELLDNADLIRLADRADETGRHELASRLWLALADRRCRAADLRARAAAANARIANR